MGFLPGVLQCSDKRKLLLLEELVVLLYLSQGVHYLVHVCFFLDLGRKGEKGSCSLGIMQFYASPELELCRLVENLQRKKK